jgi:hypothetical protein
MPAYVEGEQVSYAPTWLSILSISTRSSDDTFLQFAFFVFKGPF